MIAAESYTLGTNLLEMSCQTSPPLARCAPGNLCLGWECPASVVCAFLVGSLCGGCGCLAFVVGLRWGSVDVWPGGAYIRWVGVSFPCQCEMTFGLPSRITPHNFLKLYLSKILIQSFNWTTVPISPILIFQPGCSFKLFL